MTSGVALALVRMGGRPCAIPCEHIVEIAPRVLLDKLPDGPPQVLGVINLRGKVVPVVDVRLKVANLEDRSLPPYQHLVIVQAGGRQIGLAVDEVVEVRTVASSEVEKPTELAGAAGPGVVRIDRELVLVVSPNDVLNAVA